MSASGELSVLLTVVGAAAVIALCIGAETWALWPSPAETRFCDHEVALLLASHDPIEVQRAAVLVHEVNCDVRRRVVARAP